MKRKGFIVTVAAILVAAAVAGVAVAYYLGQGSGSANASLGHSPVTLTVSVDPLTTTLYPGEQEAVTIHVATAAGNHAGRISSLAGAVTGLPAGCQDSWFVFTPTAFAPVEITNGNPATLTGTLAFTNTATDQSACSDATPTLTVTAS